MNISKFMAHVYGPPDRNLSLQTSAQAEVW